MLGLDRHLAWTAVAILISAYVARAVLRFIQKRRQFRNLPGPPHSMLFGSLISMGKVVSKLPKRVHPHVFPYFLTEEYDLPPIFYIDIHPVNMPALIILDPEIAHQVAHSGLPKAPGVKEFIEPLAGEHNLVVMSDGPLWKKWRNVFNPGFAVSHLMAQMPTIVDCSVSFVRILDAHAANNDIFRLEDDTIKVTIDVIGKVVCDFDFECLSTNNDFVYYMRKSLSWMPDSQSMNPFHKYHPLRPLYWKYYKRKMDNYIGKILDDRFATRDANQPRKLRKKTGIDLALEEYFKESGQDLDSRSTTMNSEFRSFAIDNLEILIFAGHDTTASTICYAYHLLQQNPDKAAILRKELDDIFGTTTSVADQLREDPHLINKCEYTLATIRETLRLWGPASSVRAGRPDYFIRDPKTGNMLPTDGCIVWAVPIVMGRDKRLFSDPHAFLPERFLPNHPLATHDPNAYRPFERGPRNCIGQELALLEMKVILALTVREFDITAAFGELDKVSGDGSLWAQGTSWKTGPQSVWGDDMYQILLAAGKPREGMPARVRRRKVQN